LICIKLLAPESASVWLLEATSAADFRIWHVSDMPIALSDVRFRGKTGSS
jgi:hypothetical protein